MDIDKQRQEPVAVDAMHAGDTSHDHDSISHGLDGASNSPVDHSGMPSGSDLNKAVSAESLPQSPQGDDRGTADAYTKRGYTSEIFKIELGNLPYKIGYKVSN